jgi:hypothetical protein
MLLQLLGETNYFSSCQTELRLLLTYPSIHTPIPTDRHTHTHTLQGAKNIALWPGTAAAAAGCTDYTTAADCSISHVSYRGRESGLLLLSSLFTFYIQLPLLQASCTHVFPSFLLSFFLPSFPFRPPLHFPLHKNDAVYITPRSLALSLFPCCLNGGCNSLTLPTLARCNHVCLTVWFDVWFSMHLARLRALLLHPDRRRRRRRGC